MSWHDGATDARPKKRIVRSLIQEVVADVDSEAGEIVLIIHWKGGVHTELRLPRRRRGQNKQHTPPQAVAAVHQLARICSDDLIAATLNRNGLRTGRGNRWTRERVAALRSHRKIARYCPETSQSQGWMNLTKAAHFMGVSPKTLRLAVERDEVRAQHPLNDGPWVFNRSDLQTDAAAKIADRARSRKKTAAIPPAQQHKLAFSNT